MQAVAYTALLRDQSTKVSMAEVGEPTQHGYTERVTRTIKEDQINLADYDDYYFPYG